MSVKMVVTSCAAKAARRSPTTNASDSRWPPEANGGARIALPNAQLPRKSSRKLIAGCSNWHHQQEEPMQKCPMVEASHRLGVRPP